MKLPSPTIHRSIDITTLLKFVNFSTEQRNDFLVSLSEFGACSWGDNYATLITPNHLESFIDYVDQDGSLAKTEDEMSNLADLKAALVEMENQNIYIDLEA